ncbi:MAG TPA: O-antigen ligase family protein, partial [Thermoanaerobaculales bacterium]|nr:O-antigen ligase family protein [Thermoanaerobaculales bacterium]
MREDTRQRINGLLNQLVVLLAFSIPLYRKWVSIAAALIVILWLAEGRLADKLAALKRHRLTLAVAAFVGFAALSLAWSGDPAGGLAYLAKYRYLLLVPIIATSLRDDSRDRVETAFLIGTALSLAVSYAVFAGLVRFRDAYPGNPAPSMSHLDYSMVLAVGGLIALARLLEEERPLRQRLAWAALATFVVSGLLINIGRSGQVAFVGAALVLTPVILGRRSRRAAAGGLAAVVVVLVAAYFAVGPFRSRVLGGVRELEAAVVEGRYDSNQGKRVAGAIVALDMVRERPLVGTGVGATMERFRELLDERHPELAPVVSWFPHFHNQYLQTVTETGLVGLASLIGLMV